MKCSLCGSIIDLIAYPFHPGKVKCDNKLVVLKSKVEITFCKMCLLTLKRSNIKKAIIFISINIIFFSSIISLLINFNGSRYISLSLILIPFSFIFTIWKYLANKDIILAAHLAKKIKYNETYPILYAPYYLNNLTRKLPWQNKSAYTVEYVD